MEYSADLFTSKKTPSPDTRYYYEITGAFYSVFSNGEDDFHMAIEDKASLFISIIYIFLKSSIRSTPKNMDWSKIPIFLAKFCSRFLAYR